MKTLIPIIILLSCLALHGYCQTVTDSTGVNRDLALKVYLDCDYCDFDYFRTNFTEVNYVHDRQDADVHVLVNQLTNGSGGEEYHLNFLGRDRFLSLRDTLVFSMPGNATEDETRHALLQNVQLGLVPYLIKTPSKNRMSLFFDDIPYVEEAKDPWKNWMFEVSGSGSFFYQRSSTDFSLNGSIYVNKVTPEMKFESSNSFDYGESRLRLYEEDSLAFKLDIIQRSYSSYNRYIKSLTDHSGLGVKAVYRKSDYSNLDYQGVAGPMIEFNFFPYSEASERQLRINYSLLFEYSGYNKMTIYNKMSDQLFRHEINLELSYSKPWGSINSTTWISGYLNDLEQFAAGTYNTASIRLSKGLSFFASFGFSYSMNQIYLEKGSVSMEEFLTGQRALYSDFNYNVGMGISYRFGSIYNNAVNPRFGY